MKCIAWLLSVVALSGSAIWAEETPPVNVPAGAVGQAPATAPATAPAAEDAAVVDAARWAKVPVVLRVKWKGMSPPGGNPSDTVEVVRVIKNESKEKWAGNIRIDHQAGQNGVPQNAECTVYLEIDHTLKGDPWALMGGGTKTGVSHVEGPTKPYMIRD